MIKNVKFGTFSGVFTPSILTILGVIMYLRLPMIVGEAGLWSTLIIIIVAHLISATTGLSVSSIATDKKVKAGGTYYMISRSLGLPIGGTLGLALFVGLSFSVSLYLIGFSESFLNYWNLSTDINSIRLTGTIVLVAVTVLTFISTSLAIKTQFFIMAAIGLSLLSIFFGNHDYAPEAPLLSNTSSAIPVMVLFGIFFPAVTGFEAGVSMSGDLKDPKKSIPLGSIMAILMGLVVYIGLTFFFAYTVNSDTLSSDPNVLLKISWIPELVIAGIWGATLSSALGSILGAPRILQATATDKITPKFFAKGYSITNEPRNALLLTFVIAEAGILIGQLDVIARIVSIFFITTYGFLNLSAAFERWTSTDFRPEFKVSGWISLVGAIACLIVMIQLDFVAMLGGTAILTLLFLYLKRKELRLDSGDAWSGVWASVVKTGLTYLKRESIHKRNWRPNIIMFTGNPKNRKHLIEIGEAISGKLGILSGFELIKSDNDSFRRVPSVSIEGKYSSDYFQHKIHCSDVYEGMDIVGRMYGFSGVEPNSVLMGWSKNPGNKDRFIELLQTFKSYKYNTLFLNYRHDIGYGEHHSVDIWWSGYGRNLALAINIIRHIKSSHLWKSASVRLLIINPLDEAFEDIYRSVSHVLTEYREDIEIRIINNELDSRPTKEIIQTESEKTDLVILEIPDHRFHQFQKYYEEINQTLDGLGSSMLINASDEFEHLDVISQQSPEFVSVLDEKHDIRLETEPLQLSKYKEIAADVLKIETNGQKVLELFHKRTFQPLIMNHIDILNELLSRIKYIGREIEKVFDFPDMYRRRRALDKLKNEVLFQINQLLAEKMKDHTIPEQMERFQEGLDWYQRRLKEDFQKYPRNLKVHYPKEDFRIHRNDRFSLKLFKVTKKIKHAIIGQPITHNIDYSRIAKYFQWNNRQVFLNRLLNRFRHEDIAFYNNLRKITKSIINYLDEGEKKIMLESTEWDKQDKLNAINKFINEEIQNQLSLSKIYFGRLQLEFRKNLQLMNNDLSKIDINSTFKRKVRKQKYYNKLKLETASFSFDHILRVKTMLNMILMELSLNAAENRLESLHEESIEEVVNVVQKKFQRITDHLRELERSSGVAYDLNKVKIDDDFEAGLQEGFDETIQRMTSVMESMPETLEIYSTSNIQNKDQETLIIPVANMADYYFKSRFELPVEEKFKSLMDYLKKGAYKIKDVLVLSQFNIENNPPTESNNGLHQDILKDCIARIEKENEGIEDEVSEYIEYANLQFQKTFEPLTSTQIEESAEEYISGLRSYQGKRMLSGITRITDVVRNSVKFGITRLFYSRSKGILLAKKLNRSKELKSTVSNLLDLKEKVCPYVEILNALPSFYVTLFNGRSSIGKDFWIPRPVEEKLMAKAIHRYQDGSHGGILVLGERNYGKTSFCKYAIQKYLKSHNVYSVFAPIQGTVSVEDFTQSLRKATQREGEADQILNHLAPGSVVIINDLELFWERTPEGMGVIHHLGKMIDDHSNRILFIANMNPHAFKLISHMIDFSRHFIDIVNFTPYNAEELKELIMKRHQSSGMAISIKSSKIPMNELQMAQLFNGYFDYSQGNPGTALNGWLANIKKVSAGILYITRPELPSLVAVRDLSQEWTMALTQFILHKRLTQEKLERLSGWTRSATKSLLLGMLRAGIVVEKASGIYHIDPYIQPFVTLAFKDKEVLS